jgi:hypothetical protein
MRTLDPQVLRDLQVGTIIFYCFGAKFAPALEKVPHRRHGVPRRNG